MKLKRINHSLFLADFNQILETAEIIYFNNSTIEIPGKVIYTIPSNLLLMQSLNPSVVVVSVPLEELEDMLSLVKEKSNGIIFFEDDQLIPKKTIRLNILNIRDRMIILEKTKDTLKIDNDLILTTSAFVYKTEGLIFNKKIFLLNKEEFKNISTLLYNFED